MSRPRKAGALDGLSGSDASDSDTSASADSAQAQVPKRAKKEITLEALQASGFSMEGPSVLYVKAPVEAPQATFEWSDGRASKVQDPDDETHEERLRTREAATSGVELDAAIAMRAKQHSERLRQGAFEERQRLAQEKKAKQQSFNEREKRKRKEGKVAREGSTVEEEKRRARAFGVYSGFD